MQGIERVFFPEKSGQIQDRPIITMVIMGPDQSLQSDPNIGQTIEGMTREEKKEVGFIEGLLMKKK